MNGIFAVTLSDLRKEGACFSGYNRVVRALQQREFTEEDANRNSYIRHRYEAPISIEFILNSNGLDDAIWALSCVTGADRDCRLFAVWCVRQVEHLITNQRSRDAIDVAERFANGTATEEELAAARAAALDVARVAAWDAASSAAWDAASAAARDAASAAAWNAASAAAWDAASAAAWDAARVAQKAMFVKMLRGEAPWQAKSAQIAA